MPHSLILGMTESGKTTLAKKLAAKSLASNRGVLVLDPLHGAWQCSFKTSDPDEFLDVFWASKCCDVFIDEAGDAIGHYDKLMIRTATRGRHWGHNCFYVTQRGAMLSPTIRTQCRNVFLFNMAREDTQVIAREFNKPILEQAAELPQGQCYAASRFGSVKLLNAFEG